jgi:hypothetical protein
MSNTKNVTDRGSMQPVSNETEPICQFDAFELDPVRRVLR